MIGTSATLTPRSYTSRGGPTCGLTMMTIEGDGQPAGSYESSPTPRVTSIRT